MHALFRKHETRQRRRPCTMQPFLVTMLIFLDNVNGKQKRKGCRGQTNGSSERRERSRCQNLSSIDDQPRAVQFLIQVFCAAGVWESCKAPMNRTKDFWPKKCVGVALTLRNNSCLFTSCKTLLPVNWRCGHQFADS